MPSVLTLPDPADAQCALVDDCRPPLLPVSLQLGDLGMFARRRPEVSANVAVPSWEEGPSIGDVDSDMVVFPVIGVTPLIDSGTDREDELPTPDDSPGSVAVSSAGAAVPEVCPAPRGGFDLELVKALLDVLVVPMMITPIVDPVVDSMVSMAAYPGPPLPVVLVDVPVPVAESSLLQEVADSPVRECSPSFQASPVGSGYGLIPSPLSPSSQIADGHGPPPRMVTMDRMVTPSDSPLLPRPLTPQPLVEVMVVTVDGLTEEPVAVSPPSMTDLSREGPFGVLLNGWR